jgi:hypothetical protein
MRRWLSVLLALAAVTLVGAPSAGAAMNRSIVTRTKTLVAYAIESLSDRSASPAQYFAHGVWHAHNQGMWDYSVGPGTAAAVLWRTTGEQNGHLLALAEATFDTAIAVHWRPNGSFVAGPNAGPQSESGPIATIWFSTGLGTAYLELEPILGAKRAAVWRHALTTASDYLIRTTINWYINGNINLGEAEVYYMTWLATHDRRYLAAYHQIWRFTLEPSQSRWSGFGLHPVPGDERTVLGDKIRGSAAYIAESNPGAPGYDPYYTVTQLDALTRLYVLSHSRTVLRVADKLLNNELTRVTPRWYLNVSDGSRHQAPNAYVPFLTPALIVLSGTGKRGDLAHLIQRQFAMIDSHYRNIAGYMAPDYMGLSDEVAVILMATQQFR